MRFTLAVFAVLAVFAASASASDAELFTQSYAWTEEQNWGPEVLRAEPVAFNFEAIRPRERGPYRVQTLASVASSKLSFPVDGIQEELVIDRIEERGGGNFSNFGKVTGSDWQSHYTITGRAVVGELWTPQGHRSLRTVRGTTYLVDWDEAEIARRIMNEVVVTNAVKYRKRRSVRVPSPPPQPCRPEQVETTNLLVVYNDQALARVGSKEAMVGTGFNIGDGWNAGVINTTGALMDKVNVVGVERVDYTDHSAEGGNLEAQAQNMAKDLNWLENSPAVKSAMDASKADTVAFFVGRYSEVGGVAGNGNGYVVVSSLHVFVAMHELGHALILAGHEPAIYTPPPGLPVWAVDRAVPGVARGFMAYGTECVALGRDCPWQPVLAIDGVPYPGTNVMSGVKDEQENGRLLALMRGGLAFKRVSGNECVAESFGN